MLTQRHPGAACGPRPRQPEIIPPDDDPALKSAFEARSKGRADFDSRLAARDPDAVAQGWQRHYARGEETAGRTTSVHNSERRLKLVRRS
ncbi:DUF6065 family protein [Mesorhizobium sp. L-8-10]|uniref:DUF6065 family protein n=1 Tax=Mesorhizobium sp. L-8-10 TaxID=2744523 RepID=UPI00237B5405|nr:DUF6065 family protein [Mesorhizobium sp. L-8-10]